MTAGAASPPRGGNIDCPAGSVEIAKFEWKSGQYKVENGPNGVSIIGNATTATWQSTSFIRYVIIKGATYNYTYDLTDLATSGTLSKSFLFGHDISNVKFCYVDPCPYPASQPSWDGTVQTGGGKATLRILVPGGYQGISLAAPSTNVVLNGVYKTSGYPTTKTAAGASDTDVTVELSAISQGRSSFFLEVTDGCSRVLYVDPQIDWEASTIPSTVELAQNSPNPFNPTTNIQFNLNASADVRLAVFDLLGRQVRLLIDATLEPAAYTVTWDGTDDGGRQMPSGVYLYRVTAGGNSVARTMTLLK
ncbi:MAG TPA: FlgD immunoglobulin-like domain containing protein [Rhodothermales bacterium]